MKNIYLLIILLFVIITSFAQVPTVQDCMGAIPLCFDTYSTATSYSGTGNYPSEINVYGTPYSDNNCPNNCLLAGELNDVWYTFTVQTSGTVAFTISPVNTSDDYDWAVYNLTNANCSDILTDVSLQTSCNFCGIANQTGPNGAGSTNCQYGDPNYCSPFNAAISVTAGEIYVVNVSNFSSTQSGYSITFGGTAQIVDNTGPSLESILNSPACGQNVITVEFDENVTCASVGVGDFTVTGPGGPYSITNVYSIDCAAGAIYSRVFELTLSQPLTTGGTYSLNLVDQIDDICNHSTNLNSLTFNVSGIVSAIDSHIDIAVCHGDNTGQIVASATGGTPPYTYSIPGESNSTGTFNNLAAGTYLVTITDNIGVCNEVHTVTITEPDLLTVSINPASPITICYGENLNFTGNPVGGSATYSTHIWNSNSSQFSTVENPSFNTATIPGTYNIDYTVTDSYGCTATDNVVITINPSPNIDSAFVTDVTACNPTPPNGEIQVYGSGGTPTLQYSIDGGPFSANDFFLGLTVGNHTVIVQDANGCEHDTTLTINTNSGFFIDSISSSDILCYGDNNAQITVYTQGGEYFSVDNGATYHPDSVFINLPAGIYDIIAVNSVGCYSNVFTDTIIQPDQINITASIDSAYCGNTGTISILVIGGTGSYTYLWDNDSTGFSMSNLASGDYTVTVTDDNNCTNTNTFNVPNAGGVAEVNIINVTNVACWGESTGSATAQMTNGVPPFNYLWNDPLAQQTQIAIDLMVGTYIVIVSDAFGCAGTDTVTIEQPITNISSYVIDYPTSCYNGSNGYAYIYVSGGTSPYSYLWTNNQTDSVGMGFSAGNYTVTVSDFNNCNITDDFTITEPLGMNVSGVVDVSSDYYGSINLTVDGGAPPYVFTWSNDINTTTNFVSGLDGGAYFVTVTDANSCTIVDTFEVVIPLIIPTLITPNNDSYNDTWRITNVDKYELINIQIFNRWGNVIFKFDGTGNEYNDIENQWDGNFNGKELPMGSFVYIIDLHDGHEPYNGTVSIKR